MRGPGRVHGPRGGGVHGPGGVSGPGGVHGLGCLVQRGAWSWGGAWSGGMHGLGGGPGGDPSKMATAAGGMHPTGMHSC